MECEPRDMSDWSAPAYVPASSPQDVCSESDIVRFYADCLMGNDCSAFEADGDDAECGACLQPDPIDADDYGAIFQLSPRPFYRWETNVSGCIELFGDTTCADKIQAAQSCVREACASNCGVASAGYDECVSAARSDACGEYEAAAVCITSAEALDACSGGDFETMVVKLGLVFCGGGVRTPE